MRSIVLLFAFLGLAGAFQPVAKPPASSTALNFNPFKGFVESMESGYKGGDDSEYARIKAQDQARRDAQREAFEEKKSQGFKLFKDMDVKDKKFVETKYEQVQKEDVVSKWAKSQGDKGGFKFPWDN